MAEITQRTGTWTFDGETIRIVPSAERNVHPLRKALGEVAVPLTAVAGIAYEPGRKGGRLRLRLREGADPLSQVAGGRLPDASDPYQLAVERDGGGRLSRGDHPVGDGVAEYFAEELRRALLLDEVPDTPCHRYLLSGPSVPLTASGTDGTVSFDGERIRLEWNWMANEGKSHAGARVLTVDELEAVEWTPALGWENGSLRFRPKGRHADLKPEHDPNCLLLWGVRQARETGCSVLLAAAVTARLPHPGATEPAAGTGAPLPLTSDTAAELSARPSLTKDAPEGSDHDSLLRRLRELGELHREGVLTDEEFTAVKQAVLARF